MEKTQFPSKRRTSIAVAAALFAGLPVAHALDIAGTLLVDLNAADFENGSFAWTQNYANRTPDTGILGDFSVFGTPTKQTIGGATGILLDGTDYFVGPPSTYAADPIDGLSANRSVEVWVWQSNIRPEETVVSWSSRQPGANGSNMSFNYGMDARFGAVGHWGNADLGWGPEAPDTNNNIATGTPAVGQWHLLTYVFDGNTTSVYADGQLKNMEDSTAANGGALNTKTDFSINIGAQRETADQINTNLALTGAISKVRIHSGALTGAQVQANYDAEKAQFAAGVTATNLSRAPIHRWSFNNAAGAANDGDVLQDSASGANAAVRGFSANFTGTGVDLNDSSTTGSGIASYLDLPNGIISGKDNLTLETWVTVQSDQNWSRIIDFGSNSIGEVNGPGGAFDGGGSQYIILTNNINGTQPNYRLERHFPGGGGSRDSGTQGINNILGTEMHIVLTFDASTQEWKWYRNGSLIDVLPDGQGPRTITDLNNWLGRSNYSGDANLDGIYNEFRVYNYTLSEGEILKNFQTGADALNLATPTLNWNKTAGGTFAWNNSSNADNWGTGAGGSFPNAADSTASLRGNITGDQQIDLNTAVTLGALSLGDEDQTNKQVIRAGTGGKLVFSATKGGGSLNQASGSAGDEVAAPIEMQTDLEVGNFSTDRDFTISGQVSGQGSFIKTGPGRVVLTSNSTYTGPTAVQSGVLQVGNGGTTGSIGAGAVTVRGTLEFRRSDDLTVTNEINNLGGVVFVGPNKVTLAGAMTGTGGLYHDGTGSLNIADNNTINTGWISIGTADGGSLVVKESNTITTGDFNIGDFGNPQSNSTLTFTGGQINIGTLYVGKNSGISGAVTQTGGTLMRTNGGEWRIGGGGPGASDAYGSYELIDGIFDTAGANPQIGSYGLGVMTISGGTAHLGSYPSMGRFESGRGVLTVTNGTVSQDNAANKLIIAELGHGEMNISGNADVSSQGGLWVALGASGTGILNLNGGTLTTPSIVEPANGGVSLVNFNGTVIRASSGTANFLEGLDNAVVRAGGAIFDTNGTEITVAQPLTAPEGQGVTKIDIISGGTGYIGAPLVEIVDPSGVGTGATAIATVANGKVTAITITNPGTGYSGIPTVNLLGGGGTDAQVDSALLGTQATTGGLIKRGQGTLTLSAQNTYGGATVVEEGTLMVTGSIAGSGVTVNADGILGGTGTINADIHVLGKLAPGVLRGTLTLGNTDLTLGELATSLFELGGLSDLDRVVGIDRLTLDGTFQLTLADGFMPQKGDTFDLLDFTTIVASGFNVATDLQLPALAAGLDWDRSQFLSNGTLAVIPEPATVVTLMGGMSLLLGLQRFRRKSC